MSDISALTAAVQAFREGVLELMESERLLALKLSLARARAGDRLRSGR